MLKLGFHGKVSGLGLLMGRQSDGKGSGHETPSGVYGSFSEREEASIERRKAEC